MELNKNQYVVFPNGEQHGHLEARWSEREQAFYTFTDDTYEDEHGRIRYVRLFSTDIRTKETKRKKFTPTADNCKYAINQIIVDETEKSYKVIVGNNGYISRSKNRDFYDYIAKSICYTDESGTIYAPYFAIAKIPQFN